MARVSKDGKEIVTKSDAEIKAFLEDDKEPIEVNPLEPEPVKELVTVESQKEEKETPVETSTKEVYFEGPMNGVVWYNNGPRIQFVKGIYKSESSAITSYMDRLGYKRMVQNEQSRGIK